MSEIWRRFKAWIKDIPWYVPVIAEIGMVLILVFVVHGPLVFTDYIVGMVFAVVVAVFFYKVGRRQIKS